MPGVTLDETQLIRRARDGDLDAYEALVRAHQAAAFRLATVLAGHVDAEDITQSAFVKAHRALSRFRDDAPFRPWLLRIVANEARNTVRARSRRLARDHRWALVPRPDEPDGESRMLARERDEALWRAMERLAPRDRGVLGCRYLLELSVEETAAALGWPAGTVKSRQARALRRLEALLSEEEILR